MDLSGTQGELAIPMHANVVVSPYGAGVGGGSAGGHVLQLHHGNNNGQSPAPPPSPPAAPAEEMESSGKKRGLAAGAGAGIGCGGGSAAVRYRECLKNHAAAIGGNATDGCGEFMPSGEEGSLEALKCSACGCHRNFHRKEADDDDDVDMYAVGDGFGRGDQEPAAGARARARPPPPPPPVRDAAEHDAHRLGVRRHGRRRGGRRRRGARRLVVVQEAVPHQVHPGAEGPHAGVRGARGVAPPEAGRRHGARLLPGDRREAARAQGVDAQQQAQPRHQAPGGLAAGAAGDGGSHGVPAGAAADASPDDARWNDAAAAAGRRALLPPRRPRVSAAAQARVTD